MKHRFGDKSQKIEKKQLSEYEPYKLSIHTTSNFNKSDSGSKRLNISRMLEHSRKKISMRRASELFQTPSLRPQSTKHIKRNEVIEFDNIKWISIISAYDPSRLKNVSVSKKSCQKFLSLNGQNMKKDSRNMLYFNDLVRNFKSWLNKIQAQYCYIMNKFLHQKESANITLLQLRPKLEEVINQTVHMQENLEDCLKSYENHQFRDLLNKYSYSLELCRQVEDIVLSVNKSKNKILDLYKKFDNDRKIEQKINKLKKQSMNEVKSIICEYEVEIQDQIMNRIQQAINQIAQKSGEAYRKIRGVKHLIQKFQNTEKQSKNMNKIDIEAINFMGKVCKEICQEAQNFEQFSTKFLVQGAIINEDLQQIVKKYEQDVTNQRKKAIELQMKFLNIIFSETIRKLKDNSKISVVYENSDAHNEEYKKILRMIQDIADCIIEQDKRVLLQKLIKQTRTILDRLFDDLKFLKENKKFQQIDTEEGLISILEVSKLIKEYKEKILLVRKKFELTHRDLQLSSIKIDPITNDSETEFIGLVIGLSKKINNSGIKAKLQKQSCFSPISQGTQLISMCKQIENQNILQDITSISNEFLDLQSKNILEKYFGPLKLENLVFKESIVMIQIKKIALKTKHNNIIPQLTELLEKRNEWLQKHKKISPQMKRYFERILACTLVKGLKPNDIKQIQNPQNMAFPTKQAEIQGLKNKAQYRQVLFDLVQRSVSRTTRSMRSQHGDQRSDEKIKSRRILKSANIKFNFYIADILERSITNINNYINSFLKIQDLKRNISNNTYLKKDYFIEFNEKLFTQTFLVNPQKRNNNSPNESIKKLLEGFTEISYDRFLSLTRKIIQEENQWKQKEKIPKLGSPVNSKKIPVYLQKIIQALEFYKVKTQHLYEVGKQALGILQKPIQNAENSHEQIDQYLRLNVYAKIIKELVKYCKQTDQKVHVILDSQKNPIALIDSTDNVLKQVFPGLKKGKELKEKESKDLILNEAKVGIELKLKKLQSQIKNESLTKEKSKLKKNKSEMEQEIMDEKVVQKDDMQEEYPADNESEIEDNNVSIPDDDMVEQLGQEVEDEMIEDFEAPQDQIEEQKFQEQAMQDLIEESQKIGQSKGKTKNNAKKTQKKTHNQFDESESEGSDKKANKSKDDLKVEQQKLISEQKKKQEQLQEKQKQQEQQKNVQSKMEVLKNSIYEVLVFITSLHQLKKLIGFLSSFEQNYFKNFIEWTKIQHYYNNHPSQGSKIEEKEIEKYVNNLQDDGQIKLKEQYKSQPQVFNEIKNLDTIKKLKKDLLLLKNGNWETLIKILSGNRVSHNILKGKKQSLYVYIQKQSEDFDQFGSIHGYLSKNFKYYERNQFDLKGFVDKCFVSNIQQLQEDGYLSVTYEVKSQTSLIENPSEIQQKYQNLKQSIDDFSNGAKDNVNKFDFCLQLYKKALQIKQKVNLDLNWHTEKIKFLQKYGTDEINPLSYMNFVKQNVKDVIKKVKSLESKLYNLSFKCEKNNLFECFSEICELYGEEVHKKIVLSKNQSKFVVLLFDKTTAKDNEQKIKRIITASQSKDRQQKAEKILLELFFGTQYQQLAQITEEKIFLNAQRINIQQSELLLDIMKVLRIDHCYILIKNKTFEYFVLKKSKQECISRFLQEITKSIMDSNEVTKLMTEAPFLVQLKEILKSQNSSAYQQIFSKQNLNKLFKETNNSQKLYNQTQISVSEELFMFGKSWVDETVKVMREMAECFTNCKKQTNKILENLKKLKPCHYIYYKRFSKEKQSQASKLWSKHLQSFESIHQNTKSIIRKKNWILLLNHIQEKFEQKFNNEMSENILAIKSLLNTSNLQHSLGSISNQLKKVFQWIQEKDKQSGKVQFSIITLPKQQQIVYFELNNASGLNADYFVENFAFLDSINLQLREFLSNRIALSMIETKDGQTIKSFNLKKNDKLYELDTQKLSASFVNFSEQIVGQQTQKNRRKKLREFVRIFNKIYFLSRTTEEFNFNKESGLLQNIQKEFKKELEKLKLLYSFNTFLSTLSESLFKGSKSIESLRENLAQMQDNEKIKEEEIQQITQKLDKIKTNSKSNSIDSYEPFYSWFFLTVKEIMQMPFCNLITPVQKNKSTEDGEAELLGFIATQNQTKPGQVNEQLEKLLKEILPYTEHKPIYLKSNDLIVELLKEPVFVELDSQINGIGLSEIVSYLNENGLQEDQKDPDYVLHLRIDEIHDFKHHQHEQRTLYKTIPLEAFTKQPEQQFNINITQEKLSVQIEFNVILAPKNLTVISEDIVESFRLRNGTQIDKFEKVYIGKKLKLEKIKSWLYRFYRERKNQIQVQNKDKYIEEFFTGFIEYFLKTVTTQSKDTAKKVINKINFQSVFATNPKAKKTQILYLQTSKHILQACKKQLQKYKAKQYEKKPSLQKHYDKDVLSLVQKIESKVYEELVKVQSEIKAQMETKVKQQAIERVQKIYQSYKVRKQQNQQQNLQLPEKSSSSSDKSHHPQQPSSQQPLQVNEAPNNQAPNNQVPNNQVPNNQVPDSHQKQLQEINSLKESNFEEYLTKKIEFRFCELNEELITELESEILQKFDQKVKQVGKLKAKVDEVFKEESLIDGEVNVTPHRRLMLLYLVVQKYSLSQIQLFLSEN